MIRTVATMKANLVPLSLGLSVSLGAIAPHAGLALPPPEDTPEEILRTEIILEGRSPFDGQPLSAAEYAELEADIATSPFPPEINPKLRRLIFLLNVRKFLNTVLPFSPVP